MLNIAVCEDEIIDRENTEKECRAYFQGIGKSFTQEVVCDSFSSGNEFINVTKTYDIVLLDVEMPDGDGICVKEYLEKNKKDTRIIFLTNHEERILEAFGKNVLCFLKKPIKVDEFKKALDKALSDIAHTMLEVEEGGKMIILSIQQIRYIEAQDKYTVVYTKTEEHMFRKTMKFWEEQLSGYYFCRIHKSFLVNLNFFIKEKDEIILEPHKRVKISRKNKKEVMDKYKEYLRRKAGII